jgi:hypothetical protein
MTVVLSCFGTDIVNMNLRLRNRLLKLQLFQFLQEQTYGIFGQVDNLTSNELFNRVHKTKKNKPKAQHNMC